MKRYSFLRFIAVKTAIYPALLFVLYLSPLSHLVFDDWNKEDYSHCWLIPFVLAYLLWEKRKELAAPSTGSWFGMAPVALGLILFWVGELGNMYYIMYLSLWFVVGGLVWLHFGLGKIRKAGFVFILALTMFPLPHFYDTFISLRLQLVSSQLGVDLLHLFGMSAYREGNIIDLGFTQLQVVEACSGLRYVFPLMVLALLLAYWFRAHFWKRVILFFSSIPLAIFVNSFRIAATGVLCSIWGPQLAEGFFHGFAGWLIFMFAIPILLLEMWILRRLPPASAPAALSSTLPVDSTLPSTAAVDSALPSTVSVDSTLNIKHSTFSFIFSIVLLCGTLVLSHTIDFRQKIPIGKSFKEFPAQVGVWAGSREQMEQQFIDALHFSDYAMADYTNSQGKSINFYTAYYESQWEGEGTHSPEQCLPGSGWLFREAGTMGVPLGSGRSITVKRAFMEKSGQRELTYYWFPMRGRILTSLYQVKLYTFWDALTKHRTDGALVRLVTPVYPNEDLPQAEARLQDFTKDIVPVLRDYIPE